jgi:uncharacterized membrane protein
LYSYIQYTLFIHIFNADFLRYTQGSMSTHSKQSIEKIAIRATRWVGSVQSLIVHTLLFIACLILVLLGINFDKILLVLTTLVSLEAIYLSIFIQMSVNRQGRRLREVSRDIEEIQEDVEDIQEGVENIEQDVDEIQKDVEGIEKDVDEIQKDVDEIQEDVEGIGEEVEELADEDTIDEALDAERLKRIENNLQELLGEIGKLKKK